MSAVRSETLSIAGTHRLHARFWSPEGTEPGPGILLCHGFASCLKEWGDYPEILAAAGYAVLTFDFTGHGESEGPRTYVTAASHVDDTLRALDTLLARPEVEGRFALMGHSLGTAAILQALGTGRGGQAACAVLFAPPNRIRQDVGLGEWLAYAVASRLAKVVLQMSGKHMMVPYRITPKDIFVDPQAVAQAEADNILAKAITLNNYDYMIGTQDNSKQAAHVHLPVRIVVGEQDAAIANAHSRQVYDALPGGSKSWVAIPDSGHSLLGDRHKAEAGEAGLAWLREYLPLRKAEPIPQS